MTFVMHPIRRKLFRSAIVAGILSLATGAPMGLSGPAYANETIKVSTVITNGGANAVIIGKEKGLFAAEGIDVEVLKVTAQTAGNAALAAGDADVGIFGLGASFFNIARNGDFVLLAGTVFTKPGYSQPVLFTSRANYDKGFKSGAEMAGKKIGLASLGGGANYVAYRLAEKYHVPLQSLELVSLGSDGNAVAAAMAGSVDAAMIGGSVLALPFEKSGEGKVIAWSADEVPNTSSVAYTSRQVLTTRRAALVKFFRAYLKSAALYDKAFGTLTQNGQIKPSPEGDAYLAMIAAASGQAKDAILAALPFIVVDGALDTREIVEQLTAWKQLKIVEGEIDPAKLIDTTILRDAKAP